MNDRQKWFAEEARRFAENTLNRRLDAERFEIMHARRDLATAELRLMVALDRINSIKRQAREEGITLK
jgi:hypothetical protein